MVPDLIKPDQEMRIRTEIILSDLIEVKDYFQRKIMDMGD